MPKTAAAVLGFALVTGSIGLNTDRYPIVWKMVGAADQTAPVGEAIPSASVSDPAAERPLPASLEKSLPTSPAATPAVSATSAAASSTSSPEPPKTEPPKTEPPKTEPPKTEPPKTEPPKTEPPKTEPPKTEPPKTEPPKTEPPKTEPPKTEPPKTEPPKKEPAVSEDAPKPMVPVVSATIAKAGPENGPAEIRRLPPVEQGTSNRGDSDMSRLFAGTAPDYQATSSP